MIAVHTILKPRLAAAAGAIALAISAGPVAADVKAGVDAWSQGDFSRAVTEWQMPAQNGDADALFNLAQAYRLGRGVAADISRARELYAEAAQKGHIKAADNYGLLLFQQGEQEDAMPLIKDAAERGDPRAQYVMGLAHFNADYAEKDWVRAYALLTLSQSAGLPQASAALAQMDDYVPVDMRQEAQLVAREIETEAGKRRAADLASVDLGQRPVAAAPVPVAAAPTPVAVAPQPVRPVPVSATPQAPANRSGKWKVQLGAFGVKANADRLWSKLAGSSALSGTSKVLAPAGRVTRLQAVGFNSRAEAQSACAILKREGQACMVAKP
ncbi:MAG: SPOR domain-containing protein [Pseudomonadota bacterium]